jgi:hypothetical protein
MNNPPIAVGGIPVSLNEGCRLGMNDPPTAVGGIPVLRLTNVSVRGARSVEKAEVVRILFGVRISFRAGSLSHRPKSRPSLL